MGDSLGWADFAPQTRHFLPAWLAPSWWAWDQRQQKLPANTPYLSLKLRHGKVLTLNPSLSASSTPPSLAGPLAEQYGLWQGQGAEREGVWVLVPELELRVQSPANHFLPWPQFLPATEGGLDSKVPEIPFYFPAELEAAQLHSPS